MSIDEHMTSGKSRKKGLSPTEVVLIIAIISILIVVAIPSLVNYTSSAEKRSLQATAYNIQIILQAEKTAKNSIPFDSVTNPALIDKNAAAIYAYETTAYIEILKASDLYLKDEEKITDLIWEDNVLSTFTFSNDKYSITYTAAAGGFRDISQIE